MSLEFCQVISFYLSASTRLPWSVTGTSYPHVPSVCSDNFFDDFQDFCFRVLGFISPFNTFNEAIRKLLPCYGSVLVEFNPSAAGSCSSNSCEKLHECRASMGTEGEWRGQERGKWQVEDDLKGLIDPFYSRPHIQPFLNFLMKQNPNQANRNLLFFNWRQFEANVSPFGGDIFYRNTV